MWLCEVQRSSTKRGWWNLGTNNNSDHDCHSKAELSTNAALNLECGEGGCQGKSACGSQMVCCDGHSLSAYKFDRHLQRNEDLVKIQRWYNQHFFFKQKCNLLALVVDNDIRVSKRNLVRAENQGFGIVRTLHSSSISLSFFLNVGLLLPSCLQPPHVAEDVRRNLIFGIYVTVLGKDSGLPCLDWPNLSVMWDNWQHWVLNSLLQGMGRRAGDQQQGGERRWILRWYSDRGNGEPGRGQK